MAAKQITPNLNAEVCNRYKLRALMFVCDSCIHTSYPEFDFGADSNIFTRAVQLWERLKVFVLISSFEFSEVVLINFEMSPDCAFDPFTDKIRR